MSVVNSLVLITIHWLPLASTGYSYCLMVINSNVFTNDYKQSLVFRLPIPLSRNGTDHNHQYKQAIFPPLQNSERSHFQHHLKVRQSLQMVTPGGSPLRPLVSRFDGGDILRLHTKHLHQTINSQQFYNEANRKVNQFCIPCSFDIFLFLNF